MYPEESVRCQALFIIAHFAAHRIAFCIRIDDHILILRFNKQDFCQPKPDFSFIGFDPELLFVFDFLQNMINDRFDLLFIRRLCQIAQCIDLIALNRIFNMTGQKDDVDFAAELSQLCRKCQTVRSRHFDIEEHQIICPQTELLQQRTAV